MGNDIKYWAKRLAFKGQLRYSTVTQPLCSLHSNPLKFWNLIMILGNMRLGTGRFRFSKLGKSCNWAGSWTVFKLPTLCIIRHKDVHLKLAIFYILPPLSQFVQFGWLTHWYNYMVAGSTENCSQCHKFNWRLVACEGSFSKIFFKKYPTRFYSSFQNFPTKNISNKMVKLLAFLAFGRLFLELFKVSTILRNLCFWFGFSANLALSAK